MYTFYHVSFFFLAAISVILWSDIVKKPQFGKRPLDLLISIVIEAVQ